MSFNKYQAEGFMCLTDFECELGMALGGNVVYPDIEDLRRNALCVDQCGIAKVRVTLLEIVQESNFSQSEQDGDAS